jgi:hypothetical protein
MLRIVIGVLCVVALVTIQVDCALGQDVIALFGDSIPSSCHSETGLGFAGFYLFHYSAGGTMGSQFRLPSMPCLTGDVFGPSILNQAYPSTGSLQTGISFDYGQCLTGWNYVATIAYLAVSGGIPACCEQPILASPIAMSGQVEAANCSGEWAPAQGVSGFTNGNSNCPCSAITGIYDEPTTWGAVKAYYGAFR